MKAVYVFADAPPGTSPKMIAALLNMEARNAADEIGAPYPPWITAGSVASAVAPGPADGS